MNRVLALVVGFAITLGAAVSLCAVLFWDVSVERGQELYLRRAVAENQLRRRHPDRPAIAWLGDSTLGWGTSDVPSYPSLVARRLRRGASYETIRVGSLGFDSYHYYDLMGPVLDLEPEAVFIVANLRLFRAPPETNWLDLASWLPPEELGRALWLPWHERGATIPRLLMAQALRCKDVEEVFFAAEGLRKLFHEELLPPGPRAGELASVEDYYLRELRSYGDVLDERTPTVRMLAAAVEMARRRGVRVFVVVAPAPIDTLERTGIDVDLAGNVAVLRRVVESAGGELVSLYDLLPPAGFRDRLDHYTLVGATRMAEALLPLVEASLPREPRSSGRKRRRPEPRDHR